MSESSKQKSLGQKPEQYQYADPYLEFQKIPGVGKSLSKDFVDLGYRHIDELKDLSPEAMYHNLMQLRGRHIDRCVLYVFRCAVYYASHTVHDSELLKWWSWKDKKP